MNCPECQDWLQRRLDGESVRDEPTLERHLAGCLSCREQHTAGIQLLHALQTLPSPAPSPDLRQRLATAVLRDRAVRRQKMQRRLYVTAGLAASVLIMLFISYAWLPTRGPVNGPDIIVKQPAPKPAVPNDKAPAEARPEPAQPALAALTERLADRTRDQARALWAAANPLDGVPVEELAVVGEFDSPQPLRAARQEVAQGMQSVTRSARQAFDYFSRELPALESQPSQ